MMMRPSIFSFVRFSLCVAICAGLSFSIWSPAWANGFKALQGVLGAMTQKPAPAAAPQMASVAAVKAALKGKWEQQIKSCYSASDTYIWAEDGGWSGYEFSCTVPAKAYTLQGFSGTLACAAEGSEYEAPTELLLAADGKSAKVTNLENGSVQNLVKCPKETENILP